MEGSESCSLATLYHLFKKGRNAARSSSVSSVCSCAILLFKILNRRQRRETNGGIEELLFGRTHTSVHEWQKRCAELLRDLCFLLCNSSLRFFEQKATEDDKWRDRRAALWPHFPSCKGRGRSAAHGSSVSSVCFCAILLSIFFAQEATEGEGRILDFGFWILNVEC